MEINALLKDMMNQFDEATDNLCVIDPEDPEEIMINKISLLIRVSIIFRTQSMKLNNIADRIDTMRKSIYSSDLK